MIDREEISQQWEQENSTFKIDPPTVLGIKEACFASYRDSQRSFRRGFEAGAQYVWDMISPTNLRRDD